jgi:hypothetical protein
MIFFPLFSWLLPAVIFLSLTAYPDGYQHYGFNLRAIADLSISPVVTSLKHD